MNKIIIASTIGLVSFWGCDDDTDDCIELVQSINAASNAWMDDTGAGVDPTESCNAYVDAYRAAVDAGCSPYTDAGANGISISGRIGGIVIEVLVGKFKRLAASVTCIKRVGCFVIGARRISPKV